MKLLELFDKVLPTSREQPRRMDHESDERYNFTTPHGQKGMIKFVPLKKETEVFFTIGTPGKTETMDITGKGEELIIFSTVLDQIKKYAAANPQQAITFSAAGDEPSRIKLYDRMLKNIPGIEKDDSEKYEVFYRIPPQE